MLFWIFVLMLVAGIALFVVYNNTNVGEWCWGTGLAVVMLSSFALVISFIGLGIEYFGVDGTVAAYQERYEMLTYQYENDIYDNDNDLGKRELIKDIQSWNEDLAKGRAIQDNFWIGIYVADIYDQFEFIELDRGAE